MIEANANVNNMDRLYAEKQRKSNGIGEALFSSGQKI